MFTLLLRSLLRSLVLLFPLRCGRMELEEYVSSLPQDKLPPDGKLHPTRKKLPPSDAVKYIPKESSTGGLTNFEEEKRKKRRQEMEAKLAVSETNNDVPSKLSRRASCRGEVARRCRKRWDEKRKEKEKDDERKVVDKLKQSESNSGGKKKSDVDEEDKFKVEMEQRLEKKTVIDKVTFFDKKTKREEIPETSHDHDEKIGHDRDSIRIKIMIIAGVVGAIVIIGLIVVVIIATTKN